MLYAILDMKNINKAQKKIFRNSTKDRMTHFNISVAVKRRRDNKASLLNNPKYIYFFKET